MSVPAPQKYCSSVGHLDGIDVCATFIVRGSEDRGLVFLPEQQRRLRPRRSDDDDDAVFKKIIPRVDARPTRVVF